MSLLSRPKIFYTMKLSDSWTPPISGRQEMENLIAEGEKYMYLLDEVVREIYPGDESFPFQHCSETVSRLGLPPFLRNPLVDMAFRSHLI